MDTPSFSQSEEREMGFSVGDLYRLDLDIKEEMKEEKDSADSAAAETTAALVDLGITATDAIADMSERLSNIEASLNNHLSILLDQNETHFRKIMDGFRAIEKCWKMSAEATIEMGDAVDQFKQLTGCM